MFWKNCIEECCLIFKRLENFLLLISCLMPLSSEKILCEFSSVKFVEICFMAQDMSRCMLCGCLKRMSILLLLDGVFSEC